jgi:hypothetical protein
LAEELARHRRPEVGGHLGFSGLAVKANFKEEGKRWKAIPKRSCDMETREFSPQFRCRIDFLKIFG